MNFDIVTGTLEILPSVRFYRGMKRDDIFRYPVSWETWIEIKLQPVAYRAILRAKDCELNDDLILIVFFQLNDGFLTGWDFGPVSGMDGPQKKPEGKYTKSIRNWFFKEFGVLLPQSGKWGDVDAAYDYHNETTSIVCNYTYV